MSQYAVLRADYIRVYVHGGKAFQRVKAQGAETLATFDTREKAEQFATQARKNESASTQHKGGKPRRPQRPKPPNRGRPVRASSYSRGRR